MSGTPFGLTLMDNVQETVAAEHVHKPTRWRFGHNSFLLDVVATKFLNEFTSPSISAPLGSSDYGI